MRFLLLILAMGWATIGSIHGGGRTFLWWPALSFGSVSLASFANRPRWLGKQADGTMRSTHRIALAPYLLLTTATWLLVRSLSRATRAQHLADGVWIGRRPLTPAIESVALRSVVDLTAEFAEPITVRKSTCFASHAILDGLPPPAGSFERLVKTIENAPRPTLVHCAQGHGRTATAAAAWLIATGREPSVSAALARVLEVRPGAHVRAGQRRALEAWATSCGPTDSGACDSNAPSAAHGPTE